MITQTIVHTIILSVLLFVLWLELNINYKQIYRNADH